jgi:glycosyltransferase involved in cell wall biosynthesis
MDTITFPSVTIGIVVTREDKYEAAVASAQRQIYPGELDIQILDNTEKKLSIGAAYNQLAETCDGEWIMYLGDDDELVPEYILSLMIFALQMQANNPVCSTSHCTLYNDQEDVRHYERIPTGMWRKDYVIAHRFNEDLKKYVDTDFLVRTGKDDEVSVLLAAWQFGYFYYQHHDNISGNKYELEKDVGQKIGNMVVGGVRDTRKDL